MPRRATRLGTQATLAREDARMADLSSGPGTPVAAVKRTRRLWGSESSMSALPWLAPALALIVGVVIFPAGYMIYNSFRAISKSGVDRGWAGWDNYASMLDIGALGRVLINTAAWVTVVVAVTLVISIALALFLNQPFPGRTAVRLALIVPWAASVVMTSTVFVYGLNRYYGIINQALVDVGLLSEPAGFLETAVPAFAWAVAVAIFVSIPFTTFVVLAGLQTVPAETVEAAHIDGAGRVSTFWKIVLPMLRPAIAVATIVNIINVFNSLPILYAMTDPIPGYDADTTTTLMFKIIQRERELDVASAISVLNFVIVLAVIVVYLRVTRPMREV